LEKWVGNVLMLNPGSCTDHVFATKRSFMVLHIDNNECKVEIIELD
jgi:predicted phosphodiesterase